MGMLILGIIIYFAVAFGALLAVLGVITSRVLWQSEVVSAAVGAIGWISAGVSGFYLGGAGLGGDAARGFTWWGRDFTDIFVAANGLFLLTGLIVVGALAIGALRRKAGVARQRVPKSEPPYAP